MREQRIIRHRGLLLLLFAGIFLGALFVKPQKVSAASYLAKGIDVSRWQGSVNWAEVKEDGIEFVMLGLGRLNGNVPQPDPYFKVNIAGALSQNIKVGVYLYSMALTETQARAEAQYVLDQIDGYKISYPVAFDIEDPTQMKLTTKERTDITIAFLQVIAEAGYYPMIYASESWFNASMDLSRLTMYDKWVARWSPVEPSLRPFTMWQYSSTGKVKGISAAVDLDYCYVDYSLLIEPREKAESSGGSTTTTEPGWKTDGKHYWYVQEDGQILKKAFKTIDGKRYFFDANGYRITGWATIGKKRYFFNSSGAMKTGWLKKNGNKYYFDKTTGVMATGWLTVKNNKYYMDCSGVMQTGWLKIGKKYYYLDKESGIMQTGWLKIGKKQYYLNKNGVRVTGTKKIKGVEYTFNSKTGVLIE